VVWFLIVVLAGALVLSLLALLVLAAPAPEAPSEEELIEQQTRRAERQLHDIARDGFVAMLDEARSRAGR
jgi:threonine/homoserine/homoserine lactone efflux protein